MELTVIIMLEVSCILLLVLASLLVTLGRRRRKLGHVEKREIKEVRSKEVIDVPEYRRQDTYYTVVGDDIELHEDEIAREIEEKRRKKQEEKKKQKKIEIPEYKAIKIRDSNEEERDDQVIHIRKYAPLVQSSEKKEAGKNKKKVEIPEYGPKKERKAMDILRKYIPLKGNEEKKPRRIDMPDEDIVLSDEAEAILKAIEEEEIDEVEKVEQLEDSESVEDRDYYYQSAFDLEEDKK